MKTILSTQVSFKSIHKNPNVIFSKKQQKIADGIEYQLNNCVFENYFYNSMQALRIENLDVYLDSEKNGKINLSVIKKTDDPKKINKRNKYFIGDFGLNELQDVNSTLSTRLKERRQEKSRIEYFALIAIMSLGTLFMAKKCSSCNIYDKIIKEHTAVQNKDTKNLKNILNIFNTRI